MSDIHDPAVLDSSYIGLTCISLSQHWAEKYAGTAVLNPDSYLEYKLMREWLQSSKTQHKFEWVNSGMYLPDYVWIDALSDNATYFKLKYAL